MESLSSQQCVPCRKNSPPVSESEIHELKGQLPEWDIVDRSGELHLERVYRFRDFQTALQFTVQVGEAAEAEGHHPALLTEWGSVTVSWWTHAIHGLHRNDFVMAAKTDQIWTRLSDRT
jgi:4a-hydroxytetrahydrobiopterin dehydratase